MSSVIVASDSLHHGRELAGRIAERLGLRTVGREILSDVAARHDVAESTLTKALDDPPTLLGMSRATRARLLALVEQATVEALADDGVVCWGLAAHLYVRGVSHILTVRVLADPARLADEIVESRRVSPEKARRVLERRRAIRRRWSEGAFGQDEDDPSLYDLVIKLSQIDADRAVDIVTTTVTDRGFLPMSYSKRVLEDILLAARAKAVLVTEHPEIEVRAVHGRLEIAATARRRDEDQKAAAIEALVAELPGVGEVKVQVSVDEIREAAASFR